MTVPSSARLVLFALLLSALSLRSQAEPPLTQAEIKEKYQNCSDGYYSGPLPGKTHYTKDDYLWVVSPEFASKYCMPPEFVDAKLKGAEAVAFHLPKEGAEHCGYNGNKENCSRRLALGFEIYYKKDLKLPAISDTKYAVGALYMLPTSKHLLSNNLPISISRKDRGSPWSNERPGFQTKFKTSSFGLVGVKGGRTVWPITALGEFMYIEELLPGYNFLSLEGNLGFFTNPRREKMGIKKFSIVLNHPNDNSKEEGRSYPGGYAHVIELPEWFTDQVRAADKLKSSDWRQLIQRTLPSKQVK